LEATFGDAQKETVYGESSRRKRAIEVTLREMAKLEKEVHSYCLPRWKAPMLDCMDHEMEARMIEKDACPLDLDRCPYPY
jgi:hypothetical protein